MDGANVFINQCLDEALTTLNRYNTDPFLDKFMARDDIKKFLARDDIKKFLNKAGINKNKLTKKQKLDLIRAAILDPNSTLSFKDLSDYVDELKWNGKQHVFLFTLKGIYSGYLEKLRKAEFIREQLAEHGCEHLFNNDTRLWEDTDPRLVGVTHTFGRKSQQGRLEFKWVETRTFMVIKILNGMQVIVPEKERSVNFFSVNLNDGSAELRLQSLKDGPERPLKDLVKIYKTEINKFINLDYFAPVPIDPIIRKFLKETILPVAGWKIEYPQTGQLKGNNNLSLFDKLKFLFKPFFSREMSIYCTCKQYSHNRLQLFFSLHGDSDEIRFNAITDWEKVNQILNQLRRFSMELLKMDELKNVAMIHPEHLRIISSIDFLFVSLKKSKIHAKDLSSMVWFPEETIIEVFKIITDLFGDKFSLKGKNSDVLVIRNCFTIRGGLQECFKRQMDNTKHKEILKPAVTPTLVVVFYMLLKNLVSGFAAWVLESILDKVLPGIPIFLVEGVLSIMLAVILFGGADIFFKLPKNLSYFLWVLLTIFMDKEKLQEKLQGKYDFPRMPPKHTGKLLLLLPSFILPAFKIGALADRQAALRKKTDREKYRYLSPFNFPAGMRTGALVHW